MQNRVRAESTTVGPVSTSTDDPDPPQDDTTRRTEAQTVQISPEEAARLDRAAARRGVRREDVVAEALDAFLAREMWSGGFIAPPPPIEIPGPYPWREGAFRLRGRRTRSSP